MISWAAWINGFLGVALTSYVGTQVLGLHWEAPLRCILATNIAGLAALLITLRAEKTPWMRSRVIYRPLWTWVLFLSVYFGTLLGFAPEMRVGRQFAWLILPVILSTGFAILVFGPIQDRLVARAQRRAR